MPRCPQFVRPPQHPKPRAIGLPQVIFNIFYYLIDRAEFGGESGVSWQPDNLQWGQPDNLQWGQPDNLQWGQPDNLQWGQPETVAPT